jgi:hypothetical protein
MTIRRLRTHITRLVLVGAMAAAVAAGGVAVGPRHEAAAAPRECSRYLAAAIYYRQTGDIWRSLGYYDTAEAAYDRSDGYYGLYDAYCYSL